MLRNLCMELGKLQLIILLLNEAAIGSSEENLALGRPATQSSTYACPGGGCVAGRAVDGNNDTVFGRASCSSTKDGPGGPNWWKVELDRAYRVRKVTVTNRGDCCASRLDYFIVGVTNSTAAPVRGNYPLCGQYPSTAGPSEVMTLDCDPDIGAGQYVIIQQPSNGVYDYLTLCEVEVYAGIVGNTHIWRMHENHRLNANRSVSFNTSSSSQCVLQCKIAVGCDSVNHFPVENICELNFDLHGATDGDLVNFTGWNWWKQHYAFI